MNHQFSYCQLNQFLYKIVNNFAQLFSNILPNKFVFFYHPELRKRIQFLILLDLVLRGFNITAIKIQYFLSFNYHAVTKVFFSKFDLFLLCARNVLNNNFKSSKTNWTI